MAACALRALTRPSQILSIGIALSPYITLIGLFTGFIRWNGGIVLGDKSNHVAAIHLSQMLYLWPLIAFFSWPLLLPHFMLIPLMALSRLSSLAGMQSLLIFRRRYFLPRTWLLLVFVLGAMVVVHFNTVVHPFILADNRHYVFYVFRLLLRPWWVRYAVTPIYVLTGWACIESRGEPPTPTAASPQQREVLTRKAADTQAADSANEDKRPLRLPDGRSTCSVSFVVITIATTSLSLCFAPLVEPRYFIIPWVVWRIHLPLYSYDTPEIKKNKSIKAILQAYDYRVVAETVWFLLVNAVTCYIFLNWTFEWPQEPGRLQRFMW